MSLNQVFLVIMRRSPPDESGSKGERSWIRQAHHERFCDVKLKSTAFGE
ncbi:MAG TPA: hypothetical protein VHO70_00385 [Chitinispirillaceae bacterium]|nr:hypothetical protein [Chitinispirillaceae bacterium]